ncbi:ribonuclease H-like domain-containing protein [Tanacetum coccineum]|uniref:Ribonuclease H-like domain-containing protein n=1 Tax=Tanacetum coccineum TaxID=301880 RepID=A0ABQ5EE10_9ASTR
MYTFDLKNAIPSGGLTCLFAKAIIDESNLWHRRLGHINFKTMNKLVRENLVRGFPSKLFENDHTCVACQKGKQHKASLGPTSSLGIIAGERIPHEASPASIPQRHVAGDSFPQRHVAGESPDMSPGKRAIVVTVLNRNVTSTDVWNLADLFHDNNEARSMDLHDELHSLKIGSLTISEYFKKIKVISVLLSNIDSPVFEKNWLMYAANGLPTNTSIASIIHHKKNLDPSGGSFDAPP